jgi:murein DD-endopeptidase MepM/ murein hydrolase activator NlpD
MRYPVGITGSRQEFEQYWYIAQDFGVRTDYGYHEGVDINLKTGGNTDLGQALLAIANGRIVYYHYGSHPSLNFGRHIAIRIDGPWGSRWVHYAHCDSADFLNVAQNVSEGQMIARLGNSGNSTLAHLHFSIFKVDPSTIGGIDKVARTLTELNSWWENPISFIQQWLQPDCPPITDTTVIPQIRNLQVGQINTLIEELESKILQIRTIVQ